MAWSKRYVQIMVSFPLADDSFEPIISCGSLSYGEPTDVYKEIICLPKPGGSIIFLDTLNHNWTYSLNSLRHYLRGGQTISTLKWMSRINTIKNYQAKFDSSSVYYVGKTLWLYDLLNTPFASSFEEKLSKNSRL